MSLQTRLPAEILVEARVWHACYLQEIRKWDSSFGNQQRTLSVSMLRDVASLYQMCLTSLDVRDCHVHQFHSRLTRFLVFVRSEVVVGVILRVGAFPMAPMEMPVWYVVRYE